MTDRDTKFLGFAKLLWPEIEIQLTVHDGFIEAWGTAAEAAQTLIAQRAYDLACHVLDNTPNYVQYEMKDIPDLTKWTE